MNQKNTNDLQQRHEDTKQCKLLKTAAGGEWNYCRFDKPAACLTSGSLMAFLGPGYAGPKPGLWGALHPNKLLIITDK
jgi:hypothetical protein